MDFIIPPPSVSPPNSVTDAVEFPLEDPSNAYQLLQAFS